MARARGGAACSTCRTALTNETSQASMDAVPLDGKPAAAAKSPVYIYLLAGI